MGSASPISRFVSHEFKKLNGGKDLITWICGAMQFLDFHHAMEEERVPLTSFNLEWDALL